MREKRREGEPGWSKRALPVRERTQVQSLLRRSTGTHSHEFSRNGASPREVAGTARGRERLEALLAGLEARVEGRDDPLTAPDVDALRRQIDLPPRPGRGR